MLLTQLVSGPSRITAATIILLICYTPSANQPWRLKTPMAFDSPLLSSLRPMASTELPELENRAGSDTSN
jgi:hypothetical protein